MNLPVHENGEIKLDRLLCPRVPTKETGVICGVIMSAGRDSGLSGQAPSISLL
jgi:hypothetical protein